MEFELTGKFKKDLKKYQNDISKLNDLKIVLEYLRKYGKVPSQYYPHRLSGDYKGFMECHIQSDFLLIWFDETLNIIKLVRLGSHSELFK
jgi:mRNA interferase YafQ